MDAHLEPWARAVLVIDPQLVLDPSQPPADAQPAAVRLIVPEALVPKLSAGRHQLGDADEPQNSYVFGEVAEIFEYTFVGPVSTGSGFVSLIARGAPPSPTCVVVRTSRRPAAQTGAHMCTKPMHNQPKSSSPVTRTCT